eukprot:scaffold273976_cov28-Tisochrysis_lutea.AAC.1
MRHIVGRAQKPVREDERVPLSRRQQVVFVGSSCNSCRRQRKALRREPCKPVDSEPGSDPADADCVRIGRRRLSHQPAC